MRGTHAALAAAAEAGEPGAAGVRINGVAPSYQSISNFSYPGARPLYIYVKNAHLQAIPGLRDYVAAWAQNWGPDGLLAKRGFIALSLALGDADFDGFVDAVAGFVEEYRHLLVQDKRSKL